MWDQGERARLLFWFVGLQLWRWTVYEPLYAVARFGILLDDVAFRVMRWSAPAELRQYIDEQRDE